MMAVALISWWYTAGWARAAGRVSAHVRSVLESFSVGLLARTLFAPFRQIGVGNVQGAFEAKLRAFGDRLFSRVFGAVIRSLFIVAGVLAALATGVVGLLTVVVWPLVPVLPLIGIVLAVVGWTP